MSRALRQNQSEYCNQEKLIRSIANALFVPDYRGGSPSSAIFGSTWKAKRCNERLNFINSLGSLRVVSENSKLKKQMAGIGILYSRFNLIGWLEVSLRN